MDKEILGQLSDCKARVKYLRESIEKAEIQRQRIAAGGEMCVADTVSCGRKGKRSLGTVTVRGVAYPEYDRLTALLDRRRQTLENEERELLEMTAEAEEYITGMENVEMRTIFSLYYIEDLNWVQVSHRMNGLYGRRKAYTESSCRRKHDRFFEKVLETTVVTEGG